MQVHYKQIITHNSGTGNVKTRAEKLLQSHPSLLSVRFMLSCCVLMRVLPHWKPTVTRPLSLPSTNYLIGAILVPHDVAVWFVPQVRRLHAFAYSYLLITPLFPTGSVNSRGQLFILTQYFRPPLHIGMSFMGGMFPNRDRAEGADLPQGPP